MSRNLSSFALAGALALCVLILAVLGIASKGTASPEPHVIAAPDQRLCVGIKCNSQAQIDQLHRVTVTVTDSNGNDTGVSVTFQPQTHVDAVVGLLMEFISYRCGIPIGPAGMHTDETTHPDFRDSDLGRSQAEDIHIPGTHKITKIKVEIFNGTTWEKASHLVVSPGEQLSAGILPVGLAYFEFGLEPFVANQITAGIELEGIRPDGSSFALSYENTFLNTATVAEINQAIGLWAQRRGLLVTYPNPTTLRFTPDPQRMILSSVWLTCYDSATAIASPNSIVEWRFDAE